MADYKTKYLYDVNVGGKRVRDTNERTEYERSLEVSSAPDTFPCGHILCHNCIRKHVMKNRSRGVWSCPVCEREFSGINVCDQAGSVSFGEGEVEHVALLSNYDQLVSRFKAVDYYTLRRLKEEKIQSKSLGMTYSKCTCSLCGENHGTLAVVQEFNQLGVRHVRPSIADPYFYRLSSGHIVTSFYSTVNSSCVCVPCTYKEIHDHPEDFPAITNNNVKGDANNILGEVGRLVTNGHTPLKALKGKNFIEIDHSISVKQKAHQFAFEDTTDLIKRMVKQQEQSLVRIAKKQIEDTGSLYHIKESNSVEYEIGETVV
ncbi:hypothetical protein FSP39_023173 [Pinctada imbricata]|uniref:RING-type domain-containing protein n=1 Tax=Pinctada imbricata TaxID=66713 RepID=A0AA88YKT3_PINIB|nr:hypothetical protein FSP39_023173 [Pinctada imbricata]